MSPSIVKTQSNFFSTVQTTGQVGLTLPGPIEASPQTTQPSGRSKIPDFSKALAASLAATNLPQNEFASLLSATTGLDIRQRKLASWLKGSPLVDQAAQTLILQAAAGIAATYPASGARTASVPLTQLRSDIDAWVAAGVSVREIATLAYTRPAMLAKWLTGAPPVSVAFWSGVQQRVTRAIQQATKAQLALKAKAAARERQAELTRTQARLATALEQALRQQGSSLIEQVKLYNNSTANLAETIATLLLNRPSGLKQ